MPPIFNPKQVNKMDRRVGLGYDSHPLMHSLDASLPLGGVKVKADWAPIARSDGDAVLHAVADAVLGAACLGDIGQYFPEKNPETAGMDSQKILRTAVDLARQAGWAVESLDLTIICERVIIGPHRAEIAKNLQELLACLAVNVKAKRFEAERDEVRCHAVALLRKEIPNA